MNPIKVLWHGDANIPTGFGKVTHSLLDRLSVLKDSEGNLLFKFLVMGVNGYDNSKMSAYEIVHWRQNAMSYPKMMGQDGQPQDDLYGYLMIPEVLEQFKPDVIVLFNDYPVIKGVADQIHANAWWKRNRPAILGYFPLDGDILPQTGKQMLEVFTRLATYTEFAKNSVEKRAKLFIEDDIKVIPHGVDKFIYKPEKPFEKRKEIAIAKYNAFLAQYRAGQLPITKDDFVILNPNRNTFRKNYAKMIEGFADFYKKVGQPANVKLLVSGHPYDQQGDNFFHIWEHVKEDYGIKSSPIFSLASNFYTPDSIINASYNFADVVINTANGGGWELTSAEAAACKTALIVPNHTCFPEMYAGAAEFLDVHDTHYVRFPACKHYEVSSQSVSDKLLKYYADPKHRSEMGQKAYDVISQDKYDWDNVALQMKDFILGK